MIGAAVTLTATRTGGGSDREPSGRSGRCFHRPGGIEGGLTHPGGRRWNAVEDAVES